MRIELITELDGQKAIGLSGIKTLADAGNATALNLLGEWLIMGFECSPDTFHAVRYFEAAARAGNTQAMLNLGICYMEGHGVKRDFYAAERWIRAADELGDEEASQVCNDLYLSTIADHKPSLHALVDFLFSKECPNDANNVTEKKKEIIARLILESSGKTMDEIQKLKGKITKNDIIAYESMNDIYLNVSDEPSIKITPEAYCDYLISRITNSSRSDLATIIKILCHLSGNPQYSQTDTMYRMASECQSPRLCKKKLSWWEKAQFDVPDYLVNVFPPHSVSLCLEQISKALPRIEEDELSSLYKSAYSSHSELVKKRSDIQSSPHYRKQKKQWIAKFTSRICELEETELTDRFRTAGDSYDLLASLHEDVSCGKYEAVTQEKWLPKIEEKVNEAQEYSLNTLCSGLSSMKRKQLITLHQTITDKFVFNSAIQQKYIVLVEDAELSLAYAEKSLSLSKLREERSNILSSTHYTENIKDKWISKFTLRILELEDATLTDDLGSAVGSYELLTYLYLDVRDGTYETDTREKWLPQIAQEANAAQEKALEALCTGLSDMDHKQLKNACQTIKDHFDFNADIQKKYLDMVESAIDVYEVNKLEELCANTDNLSSDQYTNLLRTIKSLSYKPSNAQKYIDSVSQALRNTLVIASCDKKILEDYDLDQLNDRIKAVHFSTLPSEVKEDLSQTINKYINLIYDCKDKATLALLAQCEEQQLAFITLTKLYELKDAIDLHLRLDASKKQALIQRINLQIPVATFMDKIEMAGKDYDALSDLLATLPGSNLPDQDALRLKALLTDRVLDAQKAALKALTDSSDNSHAHISKCITKARHYSHDLELRNEAIALLDQKLNDVETATLSDMCADLENHTYEQLKELLEKVNQLNFKEHHIAPYRARIINQLRELNYKMLTKKCTKSSLLAMSEEEATELISEFQAYTADKSDAEQYANQIQQVLQIKERYKTALSDLYNQSIPELMSAAARTIQAMRCKMKEYYKPEIYITGDSQLAKQEKHDTFRDQYEKAYEKPIMSTYLLNGSKQHPLLSITNLNIYIGGRVPKSICKKIPVESVMRLNPVLLLGGISVVTTIGTFDLHTELPYAGKVHLANALCEIIASAVRVKQLLQAPCAKAEYEYTQDLENCFGNENTQDAVEQQDPSEAPPVITETTVEEVPAPPVPTPTEADTIDTTDAAKAPSSHHEPPSKTPNDIETTGNSENAQPAQTALTPLEKLEQSIAFSLKSFDKHISELSPLQLSNAVSALSCKYQVVGYHTLRMGPFDKKITKAISAYAPIKPDEIPLVMEDHTILGSAKEGFVLTDRNIYIQNSSYKGKIIAVRAIKNAYCHRSSGLTYVIIVTTVGEYRISYRSNDAEATACATFLTELISWLNRPAPSPDTKGFQPVAPNFPDHQPQNKWLCQCGNINIDASCISCGRQRNTGIMLWQCICGSLEQGNFCSKCGSPRRTSYHFPNVH